MCAYIIVFLFSITYGTKNTTIGTTTTSGTSGTTSTTGTIALLHTGTQYKYI